MHPSTLFAFIALIAAPIVFGSYAPYNELNTRLSPEDVAQVRARHYAETLLDALDRRSLTKLKSQYVGRHRYLFPVAHNFPLHRLEREAAANTARPQRHGLGRAKQLSGRSVGHPEGHRLIRAKPINGGKEKGSAAHPEGHGLVRAKPLSSYAESKTKGGDLGYPEGHRLVRAKPIKGGHL